MVSSCDSKDRLRLWIRLLRSSRAIENELRERLRREFEVTLPRFDVLSALHREPDGMLMSELSRYLMVSNGNVTGIIDRLEADGQVARSRRDGDRRTSIVRLTDKGRTEFEAMAAVHETWVDELLGELVPADVEKVSTVLHDFNLNWGTRV
ncbi:MAG: MarR family transcriptional regulator [Alphaproteobacteria bacterium]|nr:MarR family transcriptional regulator [Alphaproteobacteria bacterium]